MFVQCNEFPQRLRSQPFEENRAGRTVALEGLVRHQPFRRIPGPDLLLRFAEGQRLGLGKQIGQEHVVVAAEGIKRLNKSDEVAGDELGPLMNDLVKRMLAIGTRLSPIDWAGLTDDLGPLKCDVLAIALHRQLLEISREALQVLIIRKDRHSLCIKKVVVPNTQKPHEYRQVAFERGSAEMLVHLVETVEHRPEIFGANGDHRRKANRRVHGVAPADPIPKLEHICGVDAELSHFPDVGRYGDEMPGNGSGMFSKSSVPIRGPCARWSSFPGS